MNFDLVLQRPIEITLYFRKEKRVCGKRERGGQKRAEKTLARYSFRYSVTAYYVCFVVSD